MPLLDEPLNWVMISPRAGHCRLLGAALGRSPAVRVTVRLCVLPEDVLRLLPLPMPTRNCWPTSSREGFFRLFQAIRRETGWLKRRLMR